MATDLINFLTNLIIQVISGLGYPGLSLLMAIQTMAIPMPSEIIIPFAGSIIASGKFSLFGVALTGALGSSIGGSVAYYIGYKGGRPLVERYGKYIFISSHDLELAEKFFQKHGPKAAFFGMLLPVIRSFIALPAGVAKAKYWSFVFYVFIGSLIWSTVLGYFGMKMGQNWELIRERMKSFDLAIVILVVLVAVWWVWRHVKNRKLNQEAGIMSCQRQIRLRRKLEKGSTGG